MNNSVIQKKDKGYKVTYKKRQNTNLRKKQKKANHWTQKNKHEKKKQKRLNWPHKKKIKKNGRNKR